MLIDSSVNRSMIRLRVAYVVLVIYNPCAASYRLEQVDMPCCTGYIILHLPPNFLQ